MVENGHSWSSIRDYSLSEIGVFYKTIILLHREKAVESVVNGWISTHYEHKDLMVFVNSLSNKPVRQKLPDQQTNDFAEIKSEWNRLAGFMRIRK